MTYQAYTVKKDSSTLVFPFAQPFSAPPVVILTPYWMNQNATVANVPTVANVTTDQVTIVSGNAADNYYVNILAVDATAESLDGLPISAGTIQKTTSTVSVPVAPPAPSANLLTAYYQNAGGVGHIETLASQDPAADGSSSISIISGNQAGQGYFVNYLSAGPGVVAEAQAGIANKMGGPVQRVFFPRPWERAPIVFASPWYDHGGQEVGSIETISNVTTNYFDVVSGNQASNFFVNWVAVPAGRGVARHQVRGDRLTAAIDQLCEWVPEEADQIRANAGALNSVLVNGIPPDGSVLNIDYSVPPEPAPMIARGVIPPCVTAVGRCCWDVIAVAASLVGLRFANQRRMIDAAISAVGGTALAGLQHLVFPYNAVVGAWEKAKVAFKILGGIWTVGGFRGIFRAMRAEFGWWDWITTGLAFVAQLIAWVATEGLAFVAEVALTILSAFNLGEDIAWAVHYCSGPSPTRSPSPFPAPIRG